MSILPVFDEDKRSIVFTVVICGFLGLSFVLFVVAYRNLKTENSYLKSQISSGQQQNVSFESAGTDSSASGETQLQSESNTLQIGNKITPTITPIQTPAPAVKTSPSPTLQPSPTPIPLISSATLSVEPTNGDVCGTNFKFRGYITTTGQATVLYRWKRTDAENVTMEPYPTVTFDSAETKEVNYYLTLNQNTDAEAWFEIVSPQSMASNRTRYVQQNC